MSDPAVRVVFNNVPGLPRLATGWGFACVVECRGRQVLFDTGGNGEILVANLLRLGIVPQRLDAVVLSHLHWDHLGGLDRLLQLNDTARIIVPASIAGPMEVMVAPHRIHAVTQAEQLYPGIHTTGELGEPLGEQGLLVETPDGPALITGCAHAGVDTMAAAARAWLGDLHLLMGGFHLHQRDEPEILRVIARLKGLGVRQVAPSHCTGERATELFREAWGEGFIKGGCGAVVKFSRAAAPARLVANGGACRAYGT